MAKGPFGHKQLLSQINNQYLLLPCVSRPELVVQRQTCMGSPSKRRPFIHHGWVSGGT